ncbi:tail fiber domain-containing protein [Emticicia agri]|nr:tail fiber domain-containing protein [Emticicia agri]
MMKKLLYTLFLAWIYTITIAQSTTIEPGLVLPKMSFALRNGMENPANGTLVFDTNTQSYWYRRNNSWTELLNTTLGGNFWQLSGTSIKNNNAGGFWSKNPIGVPENANNETYPPTAPVNEAGTRLMWIPSRSAFRVGTVNNTEAWSAENIGLFSFATGFNTKASGVFSSTFGYDSESAGYYAFAAGYNARATNVAAIALGSNVIVRAGYAVGIGRDIIVEGVNAIALGRSAIATGNSSVALGTSIHTNQQKGSFVFGDSDPLEAGTTYSGAPDEFVARFYNGYYFMTSGNQFRTGAFMGRGQSTWSAVSDSTRKEKFIAADGETFLLKLRDLKLGSWNYKNQDKQPERFYGPMAQEIFAAYGKDKYGTIGTDTTVSTLNMDGLLFIFAKALEQRTADLQRSEQHLKQGYAQLSAENEQLKNLIGKLDARLSVIETTGNLKKNNQSVKQNSYKKASASVVFKTNNNSRNR